MGLELKKRSGQWLLSRSRYTNGDPQSHLIIELFIQSKCSEKSLLFSPSGKFLKLYQQLFPILFNNGIAIEENKEDGRAGIHPDLNLSHSLYYSTKDFFISLVENWWPYHS